VRRTVGLRRLVVELHVLDEITANADRRSFAAAAEAATTGILGTAGADLLLPRTLTTPPAVPAAQAC
jgi:hypothetical protein